MSHFKEVPAYFSGLRLLTVNNVAAAVPQDIFTFKSMIGIDRDGESVKVFDLKTEMEGKYSSLHLVVERMEELMEGTSLEESGWFQGEIFQITCSVSWYGRFWSTTNFWYSWKRAPLPPSSLAGSRRGTEASRAAA